MNDTAKHTSPKVSSLGQDAKWVNGQDRVFGWKVVLSTIYSQPNNPKIKSVKDKALISFIICIIQYYGLIIRVALNSSISPSFRYTRIAVVPDLSAWKTASNFPISLT